jgi:hypothetical protein
MQKFQSEYNRVKEEVGSYIKKMGHNYRIMESEGRKGEISMVIIPNTGERVNLDQPSVSFEISSF